MHLFHMCCEFLENVDHYNLWLAKIKRKGEQEWLTWITWSCRGSQQYTTFGWKWRMGRVDKWQSKLPQTVMAELGNIFCSSLRWWCRLKVMSRLHSHPTLDSRGAQGNISHGGSPPQIWWGYWSHCSTTAVDRLGGHCNAWLVMLSEWSSPVRFTEAYIDHAIPPIKTARTFSQ